MARLSEIVESLELELDSESIPDYPGAFNGLQIENSGTVTRVVAAVDACLPVIEQAAQVPGTLLLVHHGIFWQGAQPIAGPFGRKVKAAIEGDLALFSSHLPLDLHPVFGNNILLAEAIGLENPVQLPKDAKSGQSIGLIGGWSGNLDDLINITARVVNGPVHHCSGHRHPIRRVAVVTGAAGGEIIGVARAGADAFITGEGPHWSYVQAEEIGLSVLYAGHYATETFGVRRLAEIVADRFGIPGAFIDHPTGL